MNAIISYDTIVEILAKPPTIDPRPNFFNLRTLQNHFARALKKIPRPQSGSMVGQEQFFSQQCTP
jgi:hypothetical protein